MRRSCYNSSTSSSCSIKIRALLQTGAVGELVVVVSVLLTIVVVAAVAVIVVVLVSVVAVSELVVLTAVEEKKKNVYSCTINSRFGVSIKK